MRLPSLRNSLVSALSYLVLPLSRAAYLFTRRASGIRSYLERSDVFQEGGTCDVLWTGLSDRILYLLSRSDSEVSDIYFIENIKIYDRYKPIFREEGVKYISPEEGLSLYRQGRIRRVLHYLETDQESGISHYKIHNLRFLGKLQRMSAEFPCCDVGIHIRGCDFVDFENMHFGFVSNEILLERLKRFVITSEVMKYARSLRILGDGGDLHEQFVEFSKERKLTFESTIMPNRLNEGFNMHETDSSDDALKDLLMLSRCHTIVGTLGKYSLTASLINSSRFLRLFESRIMNEYYSLFPITSLAPVRDLRSERE